MTYQKQQSTEVFLGLDKNVRKRVYVSRGYGTYTADTVNLVPLLKVARNLPSLRGLSVPFLMI